MSNEQPRSRSTVLIVVTVLVAFVLACGGVLLLFELFEGNLT